MKYLIRRKSSYVQLNYINKKIKECMELDFREVEFQNAAIGL